MRKRFSALLLAFATTGLLASVAGSDPQKPEAPKTELQRFHQVVDAISGQVTNAGTRLKGGAVSMSQGSGDTPATMARVCCGNNIDKIEKQLEILATSIRNLRACYRANEDVEGEVQLNFVHQDTLLLYRALGNFSTAQRRDVLFDYGSVLKNALLLRKSAKKLTECERSGTP